MPIDVFLFAKAQQIMKLTSSRMLQSCQKTFNLQTYVCEERTVKFYNQNLAKPCKELPQTIILNLSETAILIKSYKQELKITCPKSQYFSGHKVITYKIWTNKTYSILNIKSSCTVTAQNFFIDKHHKLVDFNFQQKPFQLI